MNKNKPIFWIGAASIVNNVSPDPLPVDPAVHVVLKDLDYGKSLANSNRSKETNDPDACPSSCSQLR